MHFKIVMMVIYKMVMVAHKNVFYNKNSYVQIILKHYLYVVILNHYKSMCLKLQKIQTVIKWPLKCI